MELTFLRSGGFAGSATNVQGSVKFDSSGASVSSEHSDYERVLTPTEAEQLRTMAETSAAGKQDASGPVRDGYQYDLSVRTQDGKHRKLNLGSQQPGTGSPGSGSLADWVQQEAQKIWEHRINSRRATP